MQLAGIKQMKKERSQRLQILQCFLDNSPYIDRPCQSTRKYHKETVEFVKTLSSFDEIVEGLYYQDVASKFYSRKCLEVDLWSLLKPCNEDLKHFESEIHSTDPEGKALFLITLRSLIDLQSARPCDLGVWIKDVSPDFNYCKETDHICWQSSEDYLLSITPDMEVFMGLSEGRISDLVKRIKKNPMFNISSLMS